MTDTFSNHDGTYPWITDGFVYYSPTMREGYATPSQRIELQEYINSYWFPTEMRGGVHKEYVFDSLWQGHEFLAAEDHIAVGGGTLYQQNDEGSSLQIYDAGGGVLRVKTHVHTNDTVLLAGGDVEAQSFIWNPIRGLAMKTALNFPTDADITNINAFLGFYYDRENYVGFQLDTDVSAQAAFITRSASTSTTTLLGVMVSGYADVPRVNIHFAHNSVIFSYGGTLVTHTTNIPWTRLLTPYIYLETRENAEKTMDVGNIKLMQGDY